MARLLVFDGFVFISALVFFGYLLGLNRFLAKQGNNGCGMTYMYEYPQFVRVSLPSNVSAEYRRYGLYAYSEGRQTQQTRNMQFSGIPVLFIPGQGGSLKQVRSLASVSLRKAFSSEHQFHFDFFTLDLNEEYSAMFGGVLTGQTRFAVHAVQRVLSLYRRVRPDSIVLVGHSMGGMIAKGLFLEPDFPAHAVRLVITLATPHSPVVLTDPLLKDYYQRVSPRWPPPGGNVTVVSLGGGVRDLVVRSGLTLSDQADISALTTAVPEVWMSVDHLCILWCKELVLVMVRALFDCVDTQTLQVSRDPQLRKEVFRYHLLERSAGKRFHEAVHPAEVTLPSNADWFELTTTSYEDTRPRRVPFHVLTHLKPASAHEDMLAVTVTNHKARDWLFACRQIVTVSGKRVCTTVENLSNLGRIAPARLGKHKVAVVSTRDLRLRGHNYVVIRMPPSDEMSSVRYDMFSSVSRTLTTSLPQWYLPFQATTLLETTPPHSIFYVIDLPQLERPWQAYTLSVRALTCANMSQPVVATLRIPWSHQHSSVVMRNNEELTLPVMLHTARPPEWTVPSPYVMLFLDSKCTFSVQIQSAPVDALAQLLRLFSSQLVAYVAAILLLTLRQQLMSLSTQQHCLLFHHALLQGAKPYYVLPAVKIASSALSWMSVPEPLNVLVPTPDLSSLQQSGLDFLLLPLFLYSVAFSITFLLGLLAYAAIVCSGSTLNKFALKFVGKLAGVSRTWTDWLMAAIDKVPFVVSAAMVAILLSSCGGLAMGIGTLYYFMRVCGMYEDYIEQLFFAPVKYMKNAVVGWWKGRQLPVVDDVIKEAEELLSLKSLNEFNFHLTVAMLWGSATLVHLPSVLVWAHNFKYNPVLDPDPATTSALVSSVCAAIIWTLDTPIVNSSGEMYKVMSSVMFVLACLVLMFCPISLFNLPVLAAVALVCLTLHQSYEWVGLRWQTRQPTPASDSDESDARAIEGGGDTEEEDEEDNYPTESDKSERESDKSERESRSPSRKNSRTSEVSLSSYEAVSLTELKEQPKIVDEEDAEEEEEEEEEMEEDDEDEREVDENESEDGTKEDEEPEQKEDIKKKYRLKRKGSE